MIDQKFAWKMGKLFLYDFCILSTLIECHYICWFIGRFQAIEEMVVQEQRQSTHVTTITTEQTFVQTEAVIESQNRQNQNQEYTKALAAKVNKENNFKIV